MPGRAGCLVRLSELHRGYLASRSSSVLGGAAGIIDDDPVGRGQVPLITRGLAVVAIGAAVALGIAMPTDVRSPGPLTIADPVQPSPDDPSPPGPPPKPGSSPGQLHHYCLLTGGAGHGISSSKVCWWGPARS